jgi:hypothetical protein
VQPARESFVTVIRNRRLGSKPPFAGFQLFPPHVRAYGRARRFFQSAGRFRSTPNLGLMAALRLFAFLMSRAFAWSLETIAPVRPPDDQGSSDGWLPFLPGTSVATVR